MSEEKKPNIVQYEYDIIFRNPRTWFGTYGRIGVGGKGFGRVGTASCLGVRKEKKEKKKRAKEKEKEKRKTQGLRGLRSQMRDDPEYDRSRKLNHLFHSLVFTECFFSINTLFCPTRSCIKFCCTSYFLVSFLFLNRMCIICIPLPELIVTSTFLLSNIFFSSPLNALTQALSHSGQG